MWNSPNTVMVHPKNTRPTNPAVPCPRRTYQSAHRAPPFLFFNLPIWLADFIGGGGVQVRDFAIGRRATVEFHTLCLGSDKAWAPFGVHEGDEHQHHARRRGNQLQITYISSGKDLSEEKVVHIGKGEECQTKKKLCASFPSVSYVVIPKHQSW